jgi:osmotically-inducible protein OsmY
MKRNPILYALALACLVATAACNRPASASGDRSVMDRRSDESTMSRQRTDDRGAADRPGAREEDSMARDRSPTDTTTMSDAAITTKVKAALLAEPDLGSTGIDVETVNGVVQLSGFVSSREEVDRAAEVARKVEDVKSVENQIRTR